MKLENKVAIATGVSDEIEGLWECLAEEAANIFNKTTPTKTDRLSILLNSSDRQVI